MKALLLAFISVSAFAQDGPPPGEGHRRPPPEALAACKSKAKGDSCSFTSPRGDEVSGSL